MKTAMKVLHELILHVRPPRGCAIVLSEWKSTGPTDPNWVAATGIMEATKLQLYLQKLVDLRKSDPQVDWDGIKIHIGPRRIAHWLSEVEGDFEIGENG